MGSAELGVATLAGGVASLWGLQEQSGATTAGDVSGVPGRPGLTSLQYGADGELSMGTSGTMPEGVAAEFSPASANNGIVLANEDATYYFGGNWSIFCQFAWSGSSGATLLQFGSRTGARVGIRVTPTKVLGYLMSPDGVPASATVTVGTRTGPHWACLVSRDGLVTLTVDDETPGVGTLPDSMGTLQGVEVGSVLSADPVQVAWAGFADAALPDARVADLALLATRGSERSDLRIARVLRWLGVDPDGEIQSGTADVAYQAMGGRAALEVIAEANEVERGLFHVSGDGRLVQHARAHRYNAMPEVSLDASLVAPTPVAVDTTRLVNDLTASRPYGTTYRARDEDSITAYGPRTDERTIYAASDSDLRDAADAIVSAYAHPAPRWPRVQVDLLTADADTAAAVLGVRVGDMVRVTGLPSTTPGGTSVDLFVEGIADDMSATSWVVTWSTSPATYTGAWILGDSTYSVLGSTTILV